MVLLVPKTEKMLQSTYLLKRGYSDALGIRSDLLMRGQNQSAWVEGLALCVHRQLLLGAACAELLRKYSVSLCISRVCKLHDLVQNDFTAPIN